jgi:hypothetical protein
MSLQVHDNFSWGELQLRYLRGETLTQVLLLGEEAAFEWIPKNGSTTPKATWDERRTAIKTSCGLVISASIFTISTMLCHAEKSSIKLMFRFLIIVATIASATTHVHAQTATIDIVGCGTGCRLDYTQLSPVSRTAGGNPRVLVGIKTILYPGSGGKLLGYDRAGNPIMNWRGQTYPKSEKSWIIADCKNKRVAMFGKHSDGLDASWRQAYTESGEPNDCHSACGRAYDQWFLLCRAAGEI